HHPFLPISLPVSNELSVNFKAYPRSRRESPRFPMDTILYSKDKYFNSKCRKPQARAEKDTP
ncbi:MAG: hypothetical protein ABSH41_31895, partial [Syntrophobacteraceae bacterium]